MVRSAGRSGCTRHARRAGAPAFRSPCPPSSLKGRRTEALCFRETAPRRGHPKGRVSCAPATRARARVSRPSRFRIHILFRPAVPQCRRHCASRSQACRADNPAWSGRCCPSRSRRSSAARRPRRTAVCPFPAGRTVPYAPAWRRTPRQAARSPRSAPPPTATRPLSAALPPCGTAPRSHKLAGYSRRRSTRAYTRRHRRGGACCQTR